MSETASPSRAGPRSAAAAHASSLDRYLDEIDAVALLSADEEQALGRRVRAGARAAQLLRSGRLPRREDLEVLGVAGSATMTEIRAACRDVERDGRAARRALVEANLRLVVYLTKRYAASGVPMADLIQEGNIGLLRAVDAFDDRRGYRFSTYATWRILQTIREAAATAGRPVRVPAHVAARIIRVRRARHALAQQLGREPTVDDLAQHTGMAAPTVEEAVRLDHAVVSLDTPVGERGAVLADIVDAAGHESGPEAEVVLREAVAQLLSVLHTRERLVLRLRFGLDDGVPRTLKEVAAALGLTYQRINQIEQQALARLRAVCGAGAVGEQP